MDQSFMDQILSGIIAGTLSGTVVFLGGYMLMTRRVMKEFQAKAELEQRTARLAPVQKLWRAMEPLSFFPGPQRPEGVILMKLTEDLTTWYYGTGGVYVSTGSRDLYVGLQEKLQKLRCEYGDEATLSKVSSCNHKDFHYLQHDASALRSSTAGDCGTRSKSEDEFSSQYAKDIERKIEMRKQECKECSGLHSVFDVSRGQD